MAKLGSLHAACAVALLAATPVLAQSNNATDGAAPAPQGAMPSTGTNKPIRATGGSSDGSTQAMMRNHPGHHAGMGMHAAMHPRNQANAQNTAVDMLNDQSYQAAQKGQAFGGSPAATGTDKSGSMTGSSPGKM